MTGKEADTYEFSFYKTLSRRLYRILEDTGASTTFRGMNVKFKTTAEILTSVWSSMFLNTAVSHYCFGSSFEGTTTPGLNSDIDLVHVPEFFPVVTSIADAQQYLNSLLLVQDSYTPAGYCKLQWVIHGVPVTLPQPCMLPSSGPLQGNAEDRFLFSLDPMLGLPRHGPAATIKATRSNDALDVVSAVRCHTWPDCAFEWLVRERHYNWPSREQIDKCKTLGCFFVKVGHPDSIEKQLQWRLSFSLQERLLVTDFNSVQLKCYILLKMIKKERIHKYLGEKSLTSYHFKTCMLYMIENTPAEFWTEENLLLCLQHCLHQMLVWVETGVCPNYFIPEENMFEGRVSRHMQIRICDILRLILSADFKFLLTIETDMLGIRLQESLELGIIAPGYGQKALIHFIESCGDLYSALSSLRAIFLDKCQNTTSEVFVQEVCKVKQMFLRSGIMSEHSVAEIEEAFSLLLPYIDITVMSIQTAEAKRMSASNEFIFNRLTSDRWHAVSLEADPVSAKLKQASAMCMLAYCDLSLEILLDLQDQLEQQISVCGCYDSLDSRLNSLPVISECSYQELLHKHIFTPCVVYLPAERELIPPALCYEMNRAVGCPTGYKLLCPGYDWAVVDWKVLFYYLLYLNHHHLGMEEDALADLESLSRLIDTDRPLFHPETALNILGWIYKERGLTAEAERCFLGSLHVKPTHNAASLHLQDLSSML